MTITDMITDISGDRAERIHGVVPAIVAENQDPDQIGRVRVKFPWLGEDVKSQWAKVLSFMAGKDRGAVFLPEIGDEVLVAFEHGDLNHPYVLGGLWSSEDPPPEKNADGKNNIRKIHSRKGHEITLQDDDSGAETRIELRSSAGHLIVLNDATGGEKIEIVDKSGKNKITLDSMSGVASIESAVKLEIKSQMIEIKGQTAVKVSAGATLEIQGALVKIN